MWSFMDEPRGEERSMIMHQVPSFLGTTPKGGHWKFVSGGDWKGPAVWPWESSFVRAWETGLGWRSADCKLGVILAECRLLQPMLSQNGGRKGDPEPPESCEMLTGVEVGRRVVAGKLGSRWFGALEPRVSTSAICVGTDSRGSGGCGDCSHYKWQMTAASGQELGGRWQGMGVCQASEGSW